MKRFKLHDRLLYSYFSYRSIRGNESIQCKTMETHPDDSAAPDLLFHTMVPIVLHCYIMAVNKCDKSAERIKKNKTLTTDLATREHQSATTN